MISTYNSTNSEFGYNTCLFGTSLKGFKHSEETKLKIRNSKKGFKLKEETKLKMRKPKTEQTKLKMSLAKKGKKYALKEIPTVAQDENGVMQLVYSHCFLNYKLSPWHNACRQLYMKNREFFIL